MHMYNFFFSPMMHMYNFFFFYLGCPKVGGCPSPGACWAYPRAGPDNHIWTKQDITKSRKLTQHITIFDQVLGKVWC